MVQSSKAAQQVPSPPWKVRGTEKSFFYVFCVCSYVLVVLVAKLVFFRRVRIFKRKFDLPLFSAHFNAVHMMTVCALTLVASKFFPSPRRRRAPRQPYIFIKATSPARKAKPTDRTRHKLIKAKKFSSLQK